MASEVIAGHTELKISTQFHKTFTGPVCVRFYGQTLYFKGYSYPGLMRMYLGLSFSIHFFAI